MADKRYIDAELAKEALTGWETDPTDEEIEYTIDNIPAADAAPNSKVDYARQCGYESGIRTGARKVFEEIDELIKDYAHNHLDAAELVVRLYLLKKKYTEGQ